MISSDLHVRLAGTAVALAVVMTSVITIEPARKVMRAGANVNLSVGVSGGGLSYRWQKDEWNILGATNATHTISSAN